ncbi:hypothetical protein LF1_28760 [Rubripirellula obstinata]|uniref:3-keto-alpha-glucoside-1,2-lyase/3-keto-2-hydroxy-glucal hydratase domain-containing protein n=1 Tax=Rubripirellula obstinata TaxID=406547 RepID=A0A5B1CGL6_9BACT|nr:DUF1080 domain-containing protein [Rubripirellula obstinata]KAA1260337.1 hypothetical protein LF1_28760 [Rubripirellula obstinata]
MKRNKRSPLVSRTSATKWRQHLAWGVSPRIQVHSDAKPRRADSESAATALLSPLRHREPLAACLVLFVIILATGCKQQTITENPTAKPPVIVAPQSYEASAEQLLAARLPAEVAAEGWIRLFDGHTLYGWEIAGPANWSVKDQTIAVTGGEESLLCTSMPWLNFELRLQYRCGKDTDSGVFLRTPLEPDGSGVDCFEINLADNAPAFPTGSVVGKQKSQSKTVPTDDWRSLEIVVNENDITVSIEGEGVCEYTDEIGFPAGRIGLQHKKGSIEFREIRLRPLGLENTLDKKLSQWTKYPKMPGEFSVNDQGWLHAKGGRNQLESKQSYGNFVLLAEFKMPKPEMNSGIFFRCIEGSEMMGYECQLSNQAEGGNPLVPADYGTGGFFKRQNARLVAGLIDDWSTLLLVADGPTMAAWVQGIQVSNFYDDRPPNENPRKGSKVESGTLMIQGHDPETDAYFKQLSVAKTDD